MRILYLLPQIPFPPDNGFKQRYAGLLRDLASRNEVAVVCFATPADKLSDHAAVTSEFVSFNYVTLPSSIPRSYPQGWLSSDPSEVRFLTSSPMAELVDRLVARHEPEVIVVGDPALTQYVAKHDTTPRVLDYMCDAILGFKRLEDLSSGPGKWLNALRAKKYARFLRRISRHYECCVSSSQEDRDSIATAWPSERPIDIIPVGVEPDRYPRNLAEPVPGRMIYPGAITYEPNRDAVAWFAGKILPRIRARVPNAELLGHRSPPHRRLGTKGRWTPLHRLRRGHPRSDFLGMGHRGSAPRWRRRTASESARVDGVGNAAGVHRHRVRRIGGRKSKAPARR